MVICSSKQFEVQNFGHHCTWKMYVAISVEEIAYIWQKQKKKLPRKNRILKIKRIYIFASGSIGREKENKGNLKLKKGEQKGGVEKNSGL